MKRNEKKVPEFDEIIFANRNRNYGAYDLRKRYKSATSLSILGGVALCAGLLIVLSILNQNDAAATPGKEIFVIIKPDNNLTSVKVKPPEPEKPLPPPVQNKYTAPDIVDDSVKITNTMVINDYAVDSVQNGTVTDKDTVTYVEITEIPVDPEPVISVEEMPEFPGGIAVLLKFIAENLKYPAEAIENNIQGRVIMKFAIMADGSVSRIEILRGINPLLDEEALRVISLLPKWKPGRQNGKAVPVWFTVPVTYQLKIQ
jgi:periplasmic protein TonB